ncbi:aminoacyl-tRNA hydrolase [Methylobacillus glycogenes]|uniref:aminoacyl-tRNA hydrolase n=1 Tax=Methylobacillus glycogenes TaxID=406 RepID=UPI00046F4FED|nr:aminoacyl-tRNA hydrolase [Methylobacillus glycogenes]
MNGIRLFVGLGNPGAQYEDTRHNAGFWWIDQICAQTSSKTSLEAKFFGHSGRLNGQADTWLLKPTTFMNASGRAVAALARFYKIAPEAVLVIHDELDLPPGTARLKQGGGHGGHNGLKDIAAQLGSNNFWRLRLGIGHPGERSEVVNYVLHAPMREEMQQIESAMDASTLVLPQLLQGEFSAAMLKLHTKST